VTTTGGTDKATKYIKTRNDPILTFYIRTWDNIENLTFTPFERWNPLRDQKKERGEVAHRMHFFDPLDAAIKIVWLSM
jgi:hypothetical protein